jgi:hypothetical protein
VPRCFVHTLMVTWGACVMDESRSDKSKRRKLKFCLAYHQDTSYGAARPGLPYRRAFSNLANVYGLFFTIDMQRKEDVGEPAIECVLEPFLSSRRAAIGKIGAPSSRRGRS